MNINLNLEGRFYARLKYLWIDIFREIEVSRKLILFCHTYLNWILHKFIQTISIIKYQFKLENLHITIIFAVIVFMVVLVFRYVKRK